ncbi:MAG TPA: LuxR C-terminal-related transcriptional regulator [Gemmatimonadaceae bacterium]|nr:LuxR C-terminal-related transcriptional regulator [Gemmatimonadaceae bacterium]
MSPAKARSARVTPIRPPDALQVGRAALARGAWREAKRAFQRSLAEREQPEALEGLGLAAWWLDSADLVFKSRDRAYQLYRKRGDHVAAARLAVWLAWDSGAFLGEMHVANGWLQRARTLLANVPECPEHAWVAVREGIYALLDDGDPAKALERADTAIRIGREVGYIDGEMIGGALRGFALVTAGNVQEGMRQLDEVNAAVLAGELNDPVAIALTCCYLVAACERVRDGKRALEWCRRLREFCKDWGLKPLLAVCRTQYASVCVWRGEWGEAEKELQRATSELIASRPAMSGEGQARLGELRRRQGRFDEADALFENAGHHPIAALGRAALALDRDDFRAAADLAERHLRTVSKLNRTERAAALEIVVRARLALGGAEAANAAAAELRSIADDVGTPALTGSAMTASGLVAAHAGSVDQACKALEDAADVFDKCDAPFEEARVRIDLASLLARNGDRKLALGEASSAVKTLNALDARHEAARAQAVIDVLNAKADAPVKAGRGGLTAREIDVVRLVAKGHSNAQLARALSISDHTVHRHIANILLKLRVRSRSAIVGRAAAMGLLE